jgi:hypothetical protein
VRNLILLSAMLWSSFAAATTVTTSIHDIIEPEKGEKEFLLLATDGMVYEVDAKDTEVVEKALEAKDHGLEVTLDLASFSNIKHQFGIRESVSDIEMLSYDDKAFAENTKALFQNVPTPLDGYQANSLANIDSAEEVFRSMRRDTRWRSQCYNRAHVWTYEIYRRYNINSRKVWLFFTQKYIKQYRYKWWFHVTPAIAVDGVDEDVMFDREFTRSPLQITEWKNIFMKNNAPCPEVQYYSHYRQHQWESYCYFIKSSMYYWQPFNIENLEKGEPEKKFWVESELDRAYRNAIKGRRDL